MTNLIEDVGFNKPTWNKAEGDPPKSYYGQQDPNAMDNLKDVLDDQDDELRSLEKDNLMKSLPKEVLVLGGGALIILVVIIIMKYKK
jgi:hypothetical protein